MVGLTVFEVVKHDVIFVLKSLIFISSFSGAPFFSLLPRSNDLM